MGYDFKFYEESDYEDMVRLVMATYQWECSPVGFGRVEFCRTFCRVFKNSYNGWKNTVGMYLENGQIVACVWNEGDYEGFTYFLFDSKERAQDVTLLEDMIRFTKTYASAVKEDRRTRNANLFIPDWNETLRECATKHGFKSANWFDTTDVLPFNNQEFEVKLPEGYTIKDGRETKALDYAIVHRFAFNYGKETEGTDVGEEAFAKVRESKYYREDLNLCICDPMNRPVAVAVGWYDERMSFAELEPVGVVWWERRKGLATAIIHEVSNRILRKHPSCKGIRGGDQPFYKQIGFECWGKSEAYYWENEIRISWEEESKDRIYWKEMN